MRSDAQRSAKSSGPVVCQLCQSQISLLHKKSAFARILPTRVLEKHLRAVSLLFRCLAGSHTTYEPSAWAKEGDQANRLAAERLPGRSASLPERHPEEIAGILSPFQRKGNFEHLFAFCSSAINAVAHSLLT
jgi:hypothetical protein